jgi:hypothetical protein
VDESVKLMNPESIKIFQQNALDQIQVVDMYIALVHIFDIIQIYNHRKKLYRDFLPWKSGNI